MQLSAQVCKQLSRRATANIAQLTYQCQWLCGPRWKGGRGGWKRKVEGRGGRKGKEEGKAKRRKEGKAEWRGGRRMEGESIIQQMLTFMYSVWLTWMPSCVVPSSSHGGGELVLSVADQCAPQRPPPPCAVGTLVLSPTLLPTPLRREGCHQGRPGSNLVLQSGMGALNHAVLEQGCYLFIVGVCVV